ncbi:MAG: protein kinase, partial [Planctomycetaceae bacterium]
MLRDGGRSAADGVLGDFRILREIGRGGMGVVYEAEQISLKRRVALKVLPFAAVLDKRQLQRFKTEAMAAGRLHHPHIVPVYQVGCERAVHFYAMQYIEGRNVSELLEAIRSANTTSRARQRPADDHQS